MSNISYVAIARNTTILAQDAISSGNFDQWATEILGQINPTQNQIMTDKGQYRYFIIHDQSGLNVICAASSTLQGKLAFDFLDDVQKRFNLQYARSWKNAPAFGMQQEFSTQLHSLLQGANDDKIRQIKSNLAEAQGTMTEAMQQALLRGDKIDTMSQKADVLANNAKDYERSATRVKRKMCWEKYRWYLIGAIIVVIVIIIIVLIACGGFSCGSKDESTPTPTPTQSPANAVISALIQKFFSGN